MKSNLTFLYGPQTSGKSTRLIQLIAEDHGRDLIFSGEDPAKIDNGEMYVKTTAALKNRNDLNRIVQMSQNHQLIKSPRHIIIDGVQFMTIHFIKRVIDALHQISPETPIVAAGCQYYYQIHHSRTIPVSKFLMKHCDHTIRIKRKCRFCQRPATRVLIFRDPKAPGKQRYYLVCEHHYWHVPKLPYQLIKNV